MQILTSRLYDMMKRQEKKVIDDLRIDQIGSGERSEKIRTYNFPQNRITDHRINESWFNINQIMDGALSEIMDSLKWNSSRQASRYLNVIPDLIGDPEQLKEMDSRLRGNDKQDFAASGGKLNP